MRDLLRPWLPMIAILSVPIIPFAIWGEAIEGWVAHWKSQDPAGWQVALVTVGLLASDIFLPIPSSLISTLAGWEFNVLGGTITNWVGMSLGAVLGYLLARKLGPRVASWLSRPEDLARAENLVNQFGPIVLVVGRGVPVLAEASVLIAGMHGLPWRRFLPPVLLSNLGLAFAYALVGRLAQQFHALPLALAMSILLPVCFALAFRGWSRAQALDSSARSGR